MWDRRPRRLHVLDDDAPGIVANVAVFVARDSIGFGLHLSFQVIAA